MFQNNDRTGEKVEELSETGIYAIINVTEDGKQNKACLKTNKLTPVRDDYLHVNQRSCGLLSYWLWWL